MGLELKRPVGLPEGGRDAIGTENRERDLHTKQPRHKGIHIRNMNPHNLWLSKPEGPKFTSSRVYNLEF